MTQTSTENAQLRRRPKKPESETSRGRGPAAAGEKKPGGKPRGGLPPPGPRGAGRLMVDEKVETTAVKKDVYFYYAKAVGISVAIGTLILQVVNQGFSLGTNFWLAKW